jgi:hypothetical protein
LGVITLYWPNVKEHGIDDNGVEYLADAFKTNTTLTKLTLGVSRLSKEKLKLLTDALKVNETLTKLSILVDQSKADEVTKLLTDVLKNNTTLTQLNLNSDDLLTKETKTEFKDNMDLSSDDENSYVQISGDQEYLDSLLD